MNNSASRVASPHIFLAILLIIACNGGCGLTTVRGSQDWIGVDDARLYRACHVGNYGSGVILRSDETGSLVLTCAHLVDDERRVKVHYRIRNADRWGAHTFRVLHRSHPHKEDLAILFSPQPLPQVSLPPLTIAADVPASADLLSVAFGAENRPFALTVPSALYQSSVTTVIPDQAGETAWTIPKVLLHGGVFQANSGSPVMVGDELLGLVESSPGLAVIEGEVKQGVVVSSPANILEVIREAGAAVQHNADLSAARLPLASIQSSSRSPQ